MTIAVDSDLLVPGPIRQVRLDLTTRCNLRCVYCAVSLPDYRGADMSAANVRSIVELIIGLAQHNQLIVDVNGHGETTYRAGWTEVCFALTERAVQIQLTSNFAKTFDEDELQSLACMHRIAVSIDSADRTLLQQIRRHVDLRQIVTNITLVKAAALKLHRPAPEFIFLCGLYDKNACDWEAFARFVVACDIRHLDIWNLKLHSGLDWSGKEGVRSLDDLSVDELRPRMLSVVRGLKLLKRHGVTVTVKGNFIQTMLKRVGIDEGGVA